MSVKQNVNIFEKNTYDILVILVYFCVEIFYDFGRFFATTDPFHETDPDPASRNESDS